MAHLARASALATAAILLAGLIAGCSATPPATDSPGTTTEAPDNNGGNAGDGACPELTDDEVAKYAFDVQILAQLRGQPQIDGVNGGTIAFDPDEFAATLDAMESLRGHGVEGLGEPGDSIDYYRGLNDIATRMLAVDGPVPEDLFAEYEAYAGDIGNVLGKQVAVNSAYSEACG